MPKETQEPQIIQKPAETAEVLTGIPPVEEKATKPWLKIAMFSVLGIVLSGGLVFAGYKFAQIKQIQIGSQPTPAPTEIPQPTPPPGVYHTPGMDFSLDRALRVKGVGEKDLLVLTIIFIGTEDSPWPEGTTYQYDTRAFRLIDGEGFVQEMLFSYPKIEYLTTNPISQRALQPGEKDKGEVFFEIPKDKNKFYLTYGKEMTEKILIEPELFDPTVDWEIYTSQEFDYSIKYPLSFILKDLSTDETHQIEFSGANLKVIIRANEEEESPYYLDQESSGQVEVDEIEAKLYEFPTGYSIIESHQPFIAAVFYKKGIKYIIEFHGSQTLTETANLILSTFKFLD